MKNLLMSKQILIIFALVALLVIGALVSAVQKMKVGDIEEFEKQTLIINDALFEVEVADTPSKRVQGLSGKNEIAENGGMLLVYDTPGIYKIWMKDMNFPIDIIWIGEDKRVADIIKNISPDSFPETFSSSVPAQYILEISAGSADKFGISTGDLVEFLSDNAIYENYSLNSFHN